MGSGMHIIRPHIGTEKAERKLREELDLKQGIITEDRNKTCNAYKEYVRQQKEKNPGKARRLGIELWANKYYKEYHIRPKIAEEYLGGELSFSFFLFVYSDEFRAIKKILLRRKENKPLTSKDRQAFRYLWSKGLMQGGEPDDKEGPITPLTHPGRKPKVVKNVFEFSNASGNFAGLYRFFAEEHGIDQKKTYTIIHILKRLRLKKKYEKDRRQERNNNIKKVIFPVVANAARVLGYKIRITVTNYKGEEIMVYPREQKGKHYNLILGKVTLEKN